MNTIEKALLKQNKNLETQRESQSLEQHRASDNTADQSISSDRRQTDRRQRAPEVEAASSPPQNVEGEQKAKQPLDTERSPAPTIKPEQTLVPGVVTLDRRQPAKQVAARPEEINLEAPPPNTPVQDSKGDTTRTYSSQYIELDLELLQQKGFVSTSSERRIINEEYRAIKRKLLTNAFGPLSSSLKNSNIIMVTSSRPGEGKTFTAVNLALSIALEQDKTVLLVDADVLRPNVMKTLELKNTTGLMEFLLGERADISDVMCSTNLSNLKIIPAGKAHHLSTELLASSKMFEAVEEFANRYEDRVVIVDTPPLLGINETAILANLAGQAIVVTEESKSKLADIKNAVSQLNSEMAIGFVVNKATNIKEDGAGFGYYYAGAP
jgi:receptor protein-tyrosine kinase